jgi:hypothetical protein
MSWNLRESSLYRSAGGSTPKRAPARPLPDWARVREELARPHRRGTIPLSNPFKKRNYQKIPSRPWWPYRNIVKVSLA